MSDGRQELLEKIMSMNNEELLEFLRRISEYGVNLVKKEVA